MKISKTLLIEKIKEQALAGDEVCIDLLAVQSTNNSSTEGYSWIECQLDIEDEDEDFRPY